MPNPTKRAQKAIAALAQKHGQKLTDSTISSRKVRIHTLYAGGSHLRNLLEDVDLCFAQCGSQGEWLAILSAERLIQLLETDALYACRAETAEV